MPANQAGPQFAYHNGMEGRVGLGVLVDQVGLIAAKLRTDVMLHSWYVVADKHQKI